MVDRNESSKAANLCSKLIDVGFDSYQIEIGKHATGGLYFEIAKPWEFAEFVESESVKYNRELRPTQTVYTYAAWNDYYLNFIAI